MTRAELQAAVRGRWAAGSALDRLRLTGLVRQHPGRVVVAAFVVLGIVYSVATPIFEASDEKSHYPVVQYIAGGQGLPVQDPANPGPWLQEGSQPPLYYALAAAVTFWIDTSDLPDMRKPNPHARIGDPSGTGNRNAVSHSEREAFPWHGTALAVHIIRLLSVLLGAATVGLTYRLALAVWPGRAPVAVLAAALVAFNPMFLFVSASVNNDTLGNLLSAWMLIEVVGVLRGGATPRRWIALGLGLGLGALAKLSVLSLAPLAGLALAVDAWRRRSLRPLVTGGLVVAALVLLVSGWWFWRNWTLYGEPTGIAPMMDVIGGWRQPPLSLAQLVEELPGFWLSFWGVFGLFNVVLPGALYLVYTVLALAGLAGLGYHKAEIQRLVVWFLVLAIVVNVVAAVRWTMVTMGSQGRFLFVSLPAAAALMALGLVSLAPPRRQVMWAPVLAGGLGVLALAVPLWIIVPAYARPPAIARDQVPGSAHRLDVRFEDRLGLLAAETPGEARPGNNLAVTLYWEPLSELTRDYSVTVKVYGRDGRLIGQNDSFPAQGNYPTRDWKLGQVIVDRHLVPIAADAETPAQALVEVGTYRTSSQDPLDSFDIQGTQLDRVMAGRVRLAATRPPSMNQARPVDYAFGDFASLVGYEVTPESGRAFRVVLFWQARASAPADYTIFVHLDGPAGTTHAQADSQPDDGNYPTGLWAPGDVIRDTRLLSLPADAPPGRYTLRTGLYDLATGQRVPVRDTAGRPVANDAVELMELEVGD